MKIDDVVNHMYANRGLREGKVVLPASLRRRLGRKQGDRLNAEVKSGNIVLTPKRKALPKARIIKDPLTGFPISDSGKGAPVLTSEMLAEMLADFP